MSDLEARRAAIEAKRAAKAAAVADLRNEQEVSDLEAIDALEEKADCTYDVSFSVSQFVAGHPVRLAIRPPDGDEYKKFIKQVSAAGDSADAKVKALQALAMVCWVYPSEKASREALLSANGGLLASVGSRAVKLAELKADEEKKG